MAFVFTLSLPQVGKVQIGHVTVVGLITQSLSECEAEVDLVLIQPASFTYGHYA